MSYELYTLPNCEHCQEAKRFLNESGITYEEINLGNSQGQKRFQPLYKDNRDKIGRDNHGVVLPVLVESGDSEITRIVQGEEIKQLF
mgnify:CR=1 FL=1|tara:strand:- start:482 stop:742 length:261 start_codon:yes stop_codon:yes gene_type:complete